MTKLWPHRCCSSDLELEVSTLSHRCSEDKIILKRFINVVLLESTLDVTDRGEYEMET